MRPDIVDAARMTTAHTKTRDGRIIVRVAMPLRDVLESEATADGRNLSSLIRKILIDHAARQIVARETAA